MKIEVGDRVLVWGEVEWVEDDGTPRVKFSGYPYPIPIWEKAIDQVVKRRRKPLRDLPD